ncbi:IpaD/SipD/SspD family type III secretion system needle tip protein [Arsenophonus sp. aPb]|uniref:IpaD/SipD/SspD family type III secretion system needle tip protein n=1 Tax=Arsenophonus sp. aPb TaxID=3041619 RepID=UPI002468660A|nr:IpaD/SipD/SspD family type III secretion system needle tip protein [Arsenophonus sp. aPb]WGL98969.1 IpaD/SipD/SspD family type III secretion system needle tip protein [Arsenophonus sp. aPb]
MEIYNPFINQASIFYKNDDNVDNADSNSSQVRNKKTVIANQNVGLNQLKYLRNRNEDLVRKNKKLIQIMENPASSEKSNQQAEKINNHERLLSSADALRGGQQIENQAIAQFLASLDYEGKDSEETARKIRTMRSVIDQYKEENLPGAKNSLSSNANVSQVKSSREIAISLYECITNINKDYLKVFQDSAKSYADALRELNEILASFKDAIKTDKDTIEFKFDETKKIIDKLIALKKKYQDRRLVPAEGYLKNRAEADAWFRQLGLNDEKCIFGDKINFYLKMDISFIDEIINHFPKLSDKEGDKKFLSDVKYNSARWAAWQSGFDQFKTEAQTISQTVTQKYSNANAIYDNVIKILTNTIRELQESNKSFLTI